MKNREKLIYQLFIGKVADILGIKTTEKLLKEAKDALTGKNDKAGKN